MRLSFFDRFKYEHYYSSTIILFTRIKGSMRDLVCDVNNYAWPAKQR